MSTHLYAGYSRAACGRATVNFTPIKSKVTCISCRRTVQFASKPSKNSTKPPKPNAR